MGVKIKAPCIMRTLLVHVHYDAIARLPTRALRVKSPPLAAQAWWEMCGNLFLRLLTVNSQFWD